MSFEKDMKFKPLLYSLTRTCSCEDCDL